MNVLVETYRNRALDAFICGLNGDLAKMLAIQKPQTLPEAETSSTIDKFSKFTKFFRIADRSVLPLSEKKTKVLHYFTVPKILKRSFASPIIMQFLKTLGISVYPTPPQMSEVNGTVERVHSTII